jgi:pimeloyl-ACP methyl ester carboxylesterase
MDLARYRSNERALWASLDTIPDERRVTLASTGTEVRVQMTGDGPPLLFIHGASTSGTSWAPLVARLGGFRCLVLDRPGCGTSEPLPRRLASVDDLRSFAGELVPAVLDALDIERAAVVATSFGGCVALHSAHADPERFERLLEIAYPFGAPIEKIPLAMRVATFKPLAWTLTSLPPTKAVVRSIFRQLGLGDALAANRISDEAIRWFQSVLRDTDTLRNELRTNPPIMTPFRGINPEMLFTDAMLDAIDVPLMFAWGTDDPMGGEAAAREFCARIPNARLELLDGHGHAPWLDDPDRIATLTADFLGG